MTAPVEISGLESLRKRFAELGALKGLEPALRAEAEAVAETARAELASRKGDGSLARSVQIIELSQADRPSFAVGTEDPAGWFLEFGTTRMRAAPWLGPSLHARLPSINHAVRKVLAAALKPAGKV